MFSLLDIYLEGSTEEKEVEEAHPPGIELLARVQTWADTTTKTTMLVVCIIPVVLIAVFLKENRFIARLTKNVPSSGIILILGMIISMIAYTAERGFDVNVNDDVISSESEGTIVVSSSALQHVLIFPILLYTSYTLYSRSFLKRAFFILGFAIIWTLLYVSMASIVLRYTYAKNWQPDITLTQCFVFVSLTFVADPLQVLDDFKDNDTSTRNFVIFLGSTLISYGVAMEVFNVASVLATLGENVSTYSYLYTIGSACTDSLFGIVFGILFGLVSAVITKYTSLKCQSFEPIITLGWALLGYLLCLDLGFNYIFYTIACGLVQERYSFMNMSPRSNMSTTNIVCTAAILSELLLFLLIGIEMARLLKEKEEYPLNWYFVIASIITIFIIKTLVTLSLCFVLNCFIGIPISLKWQVLLVFGGQKGPMNLAMSMIYVGKHSLLFKQSILVIISVSLIVAGIVSKYLIAHLEPKEVWKGDLMSQIYRYGVGEVDSLIGSDMTEDMGNCVKSLESKFFSLFIDEGKLTDVYRMHREEERVQALRQLEKHDYAMPVNEDT